MGKQAALRPTALHPHSWPRPPLWGPQAPAPCHPQLWLLGLGCSQQHQRVEQRLSIPVSLLYGEPRDVHLLEEVMDCPGPQNWDRQPWIKMRSQSPLLGTSWYTRPVGFLTSCTPRSLCPACSLVLSRGVHVLKQRRLWLSMAGATRRDLRPWEEALLSSMAAANPSPGQQEN